MEAIILAGGFGTRLSHIVKDIPKPMALVAGRPFLEYILDYLIENDVTRIVLATGYKHEIIEKHFGNLYKDVEIIYSVENEQLFTGGAIKKALKQCKDNYVFIINGDTYFNVDLHKMKESHMANSSEITIATKLMCDFERYGTVVLKNNRIVEFKEKKQMKKGLINGGVYLVNRNIFEGIEKNKFSFEQDVMEKQTEEILINSFESDGYFIDIGVEEDYYLAQKKFKKNKAVFLDRDGTINVDTGHLYKTEDLVFIKGIPEFIRKYNELGDKVIVITNQAGIAKGYYTEEDMHKLHNYMNEKLKSEYGAKIDAFYFCPHHPDFTGECNCRKPKTGMLEKAIKDFNIDISQSILVGDKPWDIECGEKLGIKSYYINEINDGSIYKELYNAE